MYSEKQLDALRCRVKMILSPKRFSHTLGVEKCAARLGERVLPEQVSELRAAALLHDIAKEIPNDEALALIEENGLAKCPEDCECPSIYHSILAPYVIQRDFPFFAESCILSAVYLHTTGAENMTLFDKIIFLSDFVEEGRTYDACVSVRNFLFSNFKTNPTLAIDKAVLLCLDATLLSLADKGKNVHPRTLETKDALLSKLS